MHSLSLTACSFFFRKPHKKTGFYNLNEEVISGDDESPIATTIREMFASFFQEHSFIDDNKEMMKTFRCVFDDKNIGEEMDFHYMYAKICSGAYGSAFDLVDVETKKTDFKAGANHVPERTFYIFLVIPKDSDAVKVQKGMLFFQNTGAYGIKTITTEYMNKYFTESYNLRMTCKTVASKIFVDRILTKENMRKIIMTKNHKSGDVADRTSKGYGVETRVLGNLNLVDVFWNKIKSSIDHFCKGKFYLFEFENLEYDGLKVGVEIGGRYRTVNLNNIENLSIIESIPDEVKLADGSPHQERLITHFIKVAGEYLDEMVLQIEK